MQPKITNMSLISNKTQKIEFLNQILKNFLFYYTLLMWGILHRNSMEQGSLESFMMYRLQITKAYFYSLFLKVPELSIL